MVLLPMRILSLLCRSLEHGLRWLILIKHMLLGVLTIPLEVVLLLMLLLLHHVIPLIMLILSFKLRV